jgi:hypothetical protein
MRAVALEPTIHGLRSLGLPTEATQSQQVTSENANSCTTACTNAAHSPHASAANGVDAVRRLLAGQGSGRLISHCFQSEPSA